MAADAQPQSLPSLSARMTGASTSATSTVPAQSIERERSTDRVDSWTVRSVSGTQTAAIAASIQNRPCQPVVSTSTPPSSGPSAPPAADAAPHSVTALQLSLARRDDRQQAHPAGQDRRARRALDHPPADHAGGAGRERDQHARGDEQREAAKEHLAAPEHVAERARGHDHGRADERVAGHRPLQLRDRRVDVLRDRRQQDRHGRRVRVDDERRNAGGERGRRRRPCRSGPRGHQSFSVSSVFRSSNLSLYSCNSSGQ